MDSVQISLVVMGMNSALVCLLKVVTDVKEFASIEVVSEFSCVSITSHESCEPIIGDAH